MSVQEYSTRRHRLSALAAQMGSTVAERAALIRARPSLKNAVKPTTNGKVQALQQRRQRLAQAEANMRPAPKTRPLRPVGPEACSSFGMGGLMFDPISVCYAVDGASAPTGAATRMNVQATHRQRLQRLARAEADMGARPPTGENSSSKKGDDRAHSKSLTPSNLREKGNGW
jgi:hypothetical protein